jgi:hypothetical protein
MVWISSLFIRPLRERPNRRSHQRSRWPSPFPRSFRSSVAALNIRSPRRCASIFRRPPNHVPGDARPSSAIVQDWSMQPSHFAFPVRIAGHLDSAERRSGPTIMRFLKRSSQHSQQTIFDRNPHRSYAGAIRRTKFDLNLSTGKDGCGTQTGRRLWKCNWAAGPGAPSEGSGIAKLNDLPSQSPSVVLISGVRSMARAARLRHGAVCNSARYE